MRIWQEFRQGAKHAGEEDPYRRGRGLRVRGGDLDNGA